LCGNPEDPISFEQARREVWQRLAANAGLSQSEDQPAEAGERLAALWEEADIYLLALIIQEELRRWTEVGDDWKCPTRKALEELILTHRRGEPWGLFVDRQQLEQVVAARWPGEMESSKSQPTSRGIAQRGKRGRTPGTGTYARSDEPLFVEMHRLIESGEALSVHAAAKQLAPRARGPGTEESKVSRLRKGYKKWEVGA
jgi:hypothetical protein